MIKANQTYLNAIQVIIDMLVIALSLLFAYWLRFVSPFFDDGDRIMNWINYFRLLLFTIPLFLTSYYIAGLYKPFRKIRFIREIFLIGIANSIGILMVVTVLYFIKDVNYSRLMLGFFYITVNLSVILERFVVRRTLRSLRKKGFNLKHIIVIGAGEVGRNFVKQIKDEPELGYNVVGFIDDYFPKSEKDKVPILGTTQNLAEILNNNHIDEVVIALPNTSYKRINKVIDTCEMAGVKTQVIPDYITLVQGKNAYIDELDGIPLINTRYIPLDNPFKAGFKRIFDIVGAICGIILFSPAMIYAAIGVKRSSKGPIIYKQERLGKDRKPFIIYKFRSMTIDQPDGGEKGWTVKNDSRRTKFGEIIRKYSIDELPQFFNVIKGDMSLVGPRPELPFWVDKYKQSVPHYMIKHHVRPGITGLSQVRGLRGDTSIDDRIDVDLEYIENWTPWLDLKIILKTPRAMLKGS